MNSRHKALEEMAKLQSSHVDQLNKDFRIPPKEIIEEALAKNNIWIEVSEKIESNNRRKSDVNNGGTTDYYNLPLPDRTKVLNLIEACMNKKVISAYNATNNMFELIANTLNDLIEYKKMQPWQHEVMKACYALEERAEKNGGSKIREINKIIYYAQRGLKIEMELENKKVKSQ
jgi:hypothetical protein